MTLPDLIEMQPMNETEQEVFSRLETDLGDDMKKLSKTHVVQCIRGWETEKDNRYNVTLKSVRRVIEFRESAKSE